MTAHAHNAYRTVRTTTADPITLTSMLYDGALKALRRARIFAEQQEGQRFNDEVSRAHLIVGELLATLDMSQGELPKALAAIYVYCIRRIIESRMDDVSGLVEVENHIGRIGESWKVATAELRAAQAEAAEAVA
ncbi:MAG: flagellar export chaperone FliS [Chloroflexi bacterium]|nr:flagellar export chaperone FliS [Chloroflexota bacterium]